MFESSCIHLYVSLYFIHSQVTAFAMKEYRMSLNEALAHIKKKRTVVNPNDGFVAQLRDYEGILKARYMYMRVSIRLFK